MTEKTAAAPERRPQRWGADAPADDAQARERILDGAERCYRRLGIGRTRMGDIAAEVGVHRTTLYTYFATKDAVLAAAFLREADGILTKVEPMLTGEGSFEDRLVSASVVSLRETRASQYMSLLIDPTSAGHTLHAATASEAWFERVARTLEPALTEAVAAGDVRDDVPIAAIVRWVWRMSFSLASEPPDGADGGDEGVLRAFLVPALRPGAGRL
ncbi:MAG TPA: TetR/AcrR family transcriptional regulator [Marmoricola sp.]|jgi:AcrR family transcriptional regulator|nr:TetR/AcrR family transcriptional regulator [Marmoricola sp.]